MSDEWEALPVRAQGARSEGAIPNASISITMLNGHPQLTTNISPALMRQLGLAKPCRLALAVDKSGGRLRLIPAPNGKALFFDENGGGRLALRVDWITGERRPAELCAFEVDADGALIVTLPDWARRPQGRAQPLSPAPTPAAPKPAAAKPAAPKPVAAAAPSQARQQAQAIVKALPPAQPIPDEDRAEAFDMVLKGSGARQLAEYFGWDLPLAQQIAAEARRAHAVAAHGGGAA